MYGESFDKCIGCSKKIIEAYQNNKEEFLLKACNHPDFLEVNYYRFNFVQELTGITAMLSSINVDDIESFDFDEEIM